MALYGEWCERDVGENGCAAPYVCYVNASWNNGTSLCTCSLWYGWEGDDCLSLGGAAYFLASSAVVQGVISLAALVAEIHALAKYTKTFGPRSNVQMVTMSLLCVTSMAHITWRTVVAMITLTPSGNVLDAKSNDEGRIHKLVPIERAFIVLTLSFGTLALLNVSLVWIQVAMQSTRMTHAVSRGLTTYRRTVYVFEVTYIVGLVALNSLGMTGALTFFVAPFIIFMIVVSQYGARKMSDFTEVFRTHVTDETQGYMAPSKHMVVLAERYNRVVKLVRKTAIRIAVSLTLLLISSCLYAGLTIFPPLGQRSQLRPGVVVHLVVLFNEGLPLFILCSIVSTLLYLRSNLLMAVRNNAAVAPLRPVKKVHAHDAHAVGTDGGATDDKSPSIVSSAMNATSMESESNIL